MCHELMGAWDASVTPVFMAVGVETAKSGPRGAITDQSTRQD
jgi:hypothetical protein